VHMHMFKVCVSACVVGVSMQGCACMYISMNVSVWCECDMSVCVVSVSMRGCVGVCVCLCVTNE